MEDVKINVKIKLSALWVAAMFSWVYGDLLRMYSGDFIPGELGPTQEVWLVSAITMMIPVAMIFLSLMLKYKANHRAKLQIVGT